MAGKPKIPQSTRDEVVALSRDGLTGERIAARLKLSTGAVSQILAAARKAANAGPTSSEAAPAKPPTTSAVAVPADAAAAPPEAREAREAHTEVLDAHGRLQRRLEKLDERVDREFEAPEPNWQLLRQLTSASRDVRNDLVAYRPPTTRKPEDDPAHLEMARVVVATLRARVEAGRRARGVA